jgi:lysophospholipase L1-like esterase
MDPASDNDPAASAGASLVYYVSLGDSLSTGTQPVASGAQHSTNQGYVDDVYAHYHAEASLKTSLTLVKLGCSGETTTAMINGTGSECAYQQGSQLNQALAFIKAHRSKIALVTIDIGADDIVPCFSQTSVNTSCLDNGLAAVSRDLPKILSALHEAVAAKTVIAGMSVYDPWLAYYLLGSTGRAVAAASLIDVAKYNTIVAADLAADRLKRADVWGAFSTADYTKTAALAKLGTQPLDVARICEWTWMCSGPPIGQNVHANAAGYKQIAGAFEKTIGTLSKP